MFPENSMALTNLKITNFRNLAYADFELHPKCNLFYGVNGSGKTSILEAIHYLGLVRSFRSHLIRRIIHHNTNKFSLFGKVLTDDGLVTIGVERSVLLNQNHIKISGEIVKSAAELAKMLPLQLLNQNSYRFFEQGPKLRRQFIDWGLFHVEHTFYPLWKRADKILLQRNSLLQNCKPFSQVAIWDHEFSQLGLTMHDLRKKYVENLIPIFELYLRRFLSDITISINYYAGWDVAQDLCEVLAGAYQRDSQLGYSTFGPHRADLIFKIDGVPAQDVLSRGQQKMLLYALKLAQGSLLERVSGNRCLYLIDDLSSELDSHHRQLLATMLFELNAQIFVTGLDSKELQAMFPTNEYSMFHVEHNKSN